MLASTPRATRKLRSATKGVNHSCVRHEVLFFFQAEDGIRDLTVTGVQTCALPISLRVSPRPGGAPDTACPGSSVAPGHAVSGAPPGRGDTRKGKGRGISDGEAEGEIGRASCRERG